MSPALPPRDLYIGEGFEGPGVNAAHINILLGPRSGPAGQAFATAIATPSTGHCPFMVIAAPNVPVKPMTLYVNKAAIGGELHAAATWGASQAGIARAVLEALLDGTLPPEAEDGWAIVTANWVNPACDNLDAVHDNNLRACRTAIRAAMQGRPLRADLAGAIERISNPFYTPAPFTPAKR